MIDWAAPGWVQAALAAAAILSLAFAIDLTRRRKLLARLGDPVLIARLTQSLAPRRRALRAVLIVVAVTLLVLALARPQVAGEESWRQRGIDVALVVDFSRSMRVRDMEPSDRIVRTRLEIDRLLETLAGDRIAVVAFAGATLTWPLTTDHEAVRTLLDGLAPGDLAPGTGIAGAVRAARCLIAGRGASDEDCPGTRAGGGEPTDADERRAARAARPELATGGARSRALVLFTDGEETVGRAAAELERAARQGIEVFVVGVGTVAGGPIPEFDDAGEQRGWVTGDDGQPVTSRLAVDALRELARTSLREDRLVLLDAARSGLAGVRDQLSTLKKGELAWRVVRKPREVAHWFLFPAFLALLIEGCLSDRRRTAVASR